MVSTQPCNLFLTPNSSFFFFLQNARVDPLDTWKTLTLTDLNDCKSLCDNHPECSGFRRHVTDQTCHFLHSTTAKGLENSNDGLYVDDDYDCWTKVATNHLHICAVDGKNTLCDFAVSDQAMCKAVSTTKSTIFCNGVAEDLIGRTRHIGHCNAWAKSQCKSGCFRYGHQCMNPVSAFAMVLRISASTDVLSNSICAHLPVSMNGRSHPSGCPGAVQSNGSPSSTYCSGQNGRFPWWSTCCKWSDGDGVCKPKAGTGTRVFLSDSNLGTAVRALTETFALSVLKEEAFDTVAIACYDREMNLIVGSLHTQAAATWNLLPLITGKNAGWSDVTTLVSTLAYQRGTFGFSGGLSPGETAVRVGTTEEKESCQRADTSYYKMYGSESYAEAYQLTGCPTKKNNIWWDTRASYQWAFNDMHAHCRINRDATAESPASTGHSNFCCGEGLTCTPTCTQLTEWPEHLAPSLLPEVEFLGCFSNSGGERPVLQNTIAGMTVDICAKLNEADTYIALGSDNQCWIDWGTKHEDGRQQLLDTDCSTLGTDTMNRPLGGTNYDSNFDLLTQMNGDYCASESNAQLPTTRPSSQHSNQAWHTGDRASLSLGKFFFLVLLSLHI